MKYLVSVLTLLIGSGVFAQDLQQMMRETSAPLFVQDELDENPSTSVAVKQKNPKAAFFMSALVPGSGQVYAKSYLKAAAFVAVEATAWVLHANYRDQGKQIEDEFHNYANTHWSEPDYWKWIAHQSGLEYNPNNLEPLRDWEHQHFSHGLHRDKDQQYYEMIGKYHQFSWGWDDFRENHDISITTGEVTARYNETGELNPNRAHYESRRDASNDALKNATTATTFALINHLLSAVDAAWTTSRYNKRVTMSLRLEPMYYAYQTNTALTLRVNW